MRTPHHQDDYGAVSVERFAAMHAISRAQAFKEIASGRLVARKIGARTVILIEDAIKWRRALPKKTVRNVETKGPNGRDTAGATRRGLHREGW
jgi:hypothetical protein